MRLIDADRLLTERMMSKHYHLPNGDVAVPIIEIEHAPTIELQADKRIVGKWTVDNYGFTVCSACKSHALQDMCGCVVNRQLQQIKSHFCPNCGADMRGGKTDETNRC